MKNFTCENLSFYYGKKIILKNVSINLKKGDVVGLLGANGAGKTTLLKLLARIYDSDVSKNYTVSYIVEKPNFYPYMSGYQNLKYFDSLISNNLYDINEVLKLTSMGEYQNLKYSKYSSGMKMRLAIAKCLLQDADVYLFDEPLNGLDAYNINVFRMIVQKLKSLDKIVIISSHIISELDKYCNKLLIIDKDHECQTYDLKDYKGYYENNTHNSSVIEEVFFGGNNV